jgi:hypothetical protein
MTLPAGVSHDLWTNGFQVPRIMQNCANEDFTAEVKFLSGLDGTTAISYAAQGIIVQQDANNLIRFDFTTGNNDSTRAFSAVFLGGFSSPSVRIDRGVSRYNVSPLWLRVQRAGNTWTLSYSLNGTSYTVAGSFTQALNVTKIGVFGATAGNIPRQHTVDVDYFFNTAATNPPDDGATNIQNTIGPLVHKVLARPSSNAMQFSWETDEVAIGSVEYGTTPSLGEGSVSVGDLLYAQNATITGLVANTTYYYRIVGQDAAGNYDVSSTYQASTTPAPGADLVSVSDDFNGTSLDAAVWTFTNPRGDATLLVNGGSLSISVPAGVGHDIYTGDNTAPRILQNISNNNFAIAAKFKTPPANTAGQYQIQGLLVQQDSSNLMRLDLSNGGDGVYLIGTVFVNGFSNPQQVVNTRVADFGVAPLFVRVSRADAFWIAEYSTDGATWYNAGQFYNVMNTTKVGVFVGNAGGVPPAFTANIDYFQAMLPARPRLLLPANGAVDLAIPTTVSWDTTTGATVYRLQVSTDSLFSTLLVNDSTIASLSRQLTTLATQTRYFWRVRAKGTWGSGNYSTTFRFTTILSAPATPALVAPADNATAVDTSARLIWTRPVNTQAFHLQVSRDAAFTGQFAVDDTTITDTTRVYNLALNTKYYWRVRGKNSGGYSAFSAARNFTTITGIPGAPALVAPANGTTGLGSVATFRWTRTTPLAVSYKLQIATDSTFASGILLNDSTAVDTFNTVTTLAYGKKYFWRVSGKNVGGSGSYSPVWNFFTLPQDPNVPIQLAPLDGATGQPTTLTLRWTRPAGATSFRLQFGTDSSFTSGIILDDAAMTDTFRTVSGMALLTKYFWRVNADNIGGTSAFSPAWGFTTGVPMASAPVLQNPANGAQTGTAVNFAWQASTPLVDRYWIDVAADSFFTFKITDTTLTQASKIISGLIVGQKYYWRVRAHNPGGWGTFSQVWTINVSSTVAVEEERGMPERFGLSQNYPNPFNPTTQIEFAVPQESRVTVDVYTMLGEKVATVVDERMPAGYHTVRFDASQLASGLYLYRMTAGQFVMTRKMMLVR